MPRRPFPLHYDTPPAFWPAEGETISWHGNVARDEMGRFAFSQPKVKEPTATIAPTPDEHRPRTVAATYDNKTQTLRIMFRNGRVYGYYDVPSSVWRALRMTASTGRFINRRLDPFFDYAEEWPDDV